LTVVEGSGEAEAKTPYVGHVLLPALAPDELKREPVSA
jgi:hypothetical protein